MYTFQVKWPAPFKQDWQTSGQRFDTIEGAAKAMADFAAVALENDTQIECRLLKMG